MPAIAVSLPPVHLHSNAGAEPFFTVLMSVVIVVGCAVTLRKRDPVLLILCVTAAVSSLIEPVYDYLGDAWWSTHLTTSFTSFGGRIFCPTIFPLGYAMWIGVGSYASFRVFERRPSRSSILKAFLLLGLCEPALELPWLGTHLFRYFGAQPYRIAGYSLVWDAINTAGIAINGALLLWMADRGYLRGRRAMFAGVLPFSVIGWYFMGGWPTWLVMHTTAGTAVLWLAGTVSIALSALAITLAASSVATSSTSETIAEVADRSLAVVANGGSSASHVEVG